MVSSSLLPTHLLLNGQELAAKDHRQSAADLFLTGLPTRDTVEPIYRGP